VGVRRPQAETAVGLLVLNDLLDPESGIAGRFGQHRCQGTQFVRLDAGALHQIHEHHVGDGRMHQLLGTAIRIRHEDFGRMKGCPQKSGTHLHLQLTGPPGLGQTA